MDHTSFFTVFHLLNCNWCRQSLANLSNWGVDMFQIAKSANNRPLTAVVYTIMQVPVFNPNNNILYAKLSY